MKDNQCRQYNQAIVIIFGLVFSSFFLFTCFLDRHQILAAPSLTGAQGFDEKVKFFSEHKPKRSQILALGSSMTLNHIDPNLLITRNGTPISFTNFAAWGLQINHLQSLLSITNRLIGKPKLVFILSSFADFRDCSAPTEARDQVLPQVSYFDNLEPDAVVNYINSPAPTFHSIYYHFKYRSLNKIFDIKSIDKLRRQRTRNDIYSSLLFDSSGTVLLELPSEKISPQRWRGNPDWLKVSHTCYKSLDKLIADAENQNLATIFVLTPIRKGYLDEFDAEGTLFASHQNKVKLTLSKHQTLLINAHQDLQLTDKYFIDALHLNKQGARILTEHIKQEIQRKTDLSVFE